jgi:hypothetical protein
MWRAQKAGSIGILLVALLSGCGAAVEKNDANTLAVEQSAAQEQLTDQWAVRLAPGADVAAVARQMGASNLGQIAQLADTYLFRFDGVAEEFEGRLRASTAVVWWERQVARQRHTR